MECFNCLGSINDFCITLEGGLRFCSKPCCQAYFQDGLKKNMENSANSMKQPHSPEFVQLFKTEYLLTRAILSRSNTTQLLQLRKLYMEQGVNAMEETSTCQFNEGDYLRLSNAMMDKLKSIDNLIKIFGS